LKKRRKIADLFPEKVDFASDNLTLYDYKPLEI